MPQPSSEIARVKRTVRERDGMRCTKCGLSDAEHRKRHRRTLDVHRLAPGGLYAVGDCVTLCKACHAPEPKRAKGQPDLATGAHLFRFVDIRPRLAAAALAFVGRDLTQFVNDALRERLERLSRWPPPGQKHTS